MARSFNEISFHGQLLTVPVKLINLLGKSEAAAYWYAQRAIREELHHYLRSKQLEAKGCDNTEARKAYLQVADDFDSLMLDALTRVEELVPISVGTKFSRWS